MNRDWSIASQKASNAIVEGLAFDVIRRFYEYQTPPVRMNRIDYNSGTDLIDKQKYDLKDGYGKLWEVKSDHKAVQTGNFFLEHQALEHSTADYWIVFAGFTLVIPRNRLVELVTGPYRVVSGGDDYLAAGTLVPLSELINYIV